MEGAYPRFDAAQNYNEFTRIHGFDIHEELAEPDLSTPDRRIKRSGLEVGIEIQRHKALQPDLPVTAIADTVLKGGLNGNPQRYPSREAIGLD